jgi:hypothetical protein
MEEPFKKMISIHSRTAKTQNSNKKNKNNNQKHMCWKCHQAGIRAEDCNIYQWKDKRDEGAKRKAGELISNKQVQISNKK